DRALDSIRNQAYPGQVEVVICGWGPEGATPLPLFTDRSVKLSWALKPTRERASALNVGLEQASGDLVAYLRLGERLSVGALRAVGQAFVKSPEVELVYGNALHVIEERVYHA